MKTLLVVIIMTPIAVLLDRDSFRYCCYIKHRLEFLDIHIDPFVIFGEMGVI
jgi:hypothetical protein